MAVYSVHTLNPINRGHMTDLSIDELKRYVTYDPETGIITWKTRSTSEYPADRTPFIKSWNTRYAGKEAFSYVVDGMKRGRINNRQYLAARVAYALMYGYWPEVVEHRNGDKLDNRIENLRPVTKSEIALIREQRHRESIE